MRQLELFPGLAAAGGTPSGGARRWHGSYGVPYMGSKNKIADWVVGVLPPGRRLVDLFAGGCAVTHCAMLSGKWRRFVVNDTGDAPKLFVDAIHGKYRDERRWIGRADFFRLKDSDPYVRYCWSFGNNGRCYLYGRAIEPYKRAAHYAVAFGEWGGMDALCPEVSGMAKAALKGLRSLHDRRLAFNHAVVSYVRNAGHMRGGNLLYEKTGTSNPHGFTQNLERLERLQGLQGLQGLERLQGLQGLERLQGDYRDVALADGDVVYCDIPYRGGKTYAGAEGFCHEDFYEWALAQPVPVYVSERRMPEGFACMARRGHRYTFSASNNAQHVAEGIFVQAKFASLPGIRE